MSHVAAIKMLVKDLGVLIHQAQTECGLEFIPVPEGEADMPYRWWGHHVGDYPLPQGFTAEQLGRADVGVLRIPGAGDAAYEIGVCRRRDGQPGYTLLYDFYGGQGRAIAKLVGGNEAPKLIQAYAEGVVRKTALLNGMMASQTELLPDGSRKLILRTL